MEPPTCDNGPGYCHDCMGCARLLAWQVGMDDDDQDNFVRWVRASGAPHNVQFDMIRALNDPRMEWPATIDDLYSSLDELRAALQGLADAILTPLSRWLARKPFGRTQA